MNERRCANCVHLNTTREPYYHSEYIYGEWVRSHIPEPWCDRDPSDPRPVYLSSACPSFERKEFHESSC